ncbi:hypothetical protein PV08_05521 [Exophiala spinifera]|uniref:Uncharacterized protein n=1 Tax=Exophiala spinifera TaxID=91928 RepID=A0A0D2BA80_9EURO|nr:uncharacterized protein PV08_05521 [Exophiala spinifera]KIW15475.1 hypothetical protein PV08_05521 [Exophiala spinifera]
MYIPLVTVAAYCVAAFQPALATVHLKVRDLQAAGLRDATFRHSIRGGSSVKDIHRLESRQTAPLLVAPTAECDQYDGCFYVSSGNYTWQLQCTTNYIGSIISTDNADSLAACIESCVTFNAANEPGACLGINFNAANHAAVGQCTQYSDVQDLLLASEEGNVQDSALLILGPDGHIYATPQPAPTFSGAPSQPPTADPVPTSTTSSSNASPSTTAFSTTVSTESPGVGLGTITVTTTLTSTNFVTSCPPGATACLSTSSTLVSPSSISAASSAASSYASSGNEAISTTITPSITPTTQVTTTRSATTTTSTAPGGFVVDAITTLTMVVPVTIYKFQPVDICTGITPSCSLTTLTSTSVGYRTELSCTPSACAGISAGALADAAFAGTCILS